MLRRVLKKVADVSNGKRFNRAPIALLDKWGHKLHLNNWIQHEICDVFDEWVGLYDEWDLEAEAPEPNIEQDCCD